ncbi:KH domain-containing, RNA-binding, signal transduction-associated protein 2-like isoform X2 [Rhodnius prolixus]|uniref:KH domain-containing, RNA-binding, signal transduction-associated protein 2-like isoform X2 n=1 Tax=Rhodnius prolixus TaxID=13249 RepID=UPI003D188E0D
MVVGNVLLHPTGKGSYDAFLHSKMTDMDIVQSGDDDNRYNSNHANTQTQRPEMRNVRPENRRMVDITRDKPIKVTIRVVVPVRDHPKFNFVGKLLGPKGNSLKRLQEETMTKMAILGRGSMKDRHKEEELRGSGDPKFSHLLEELHVEVTAFAPPAEAHARIAYALAEDYNDDIRQEQMWEMAAMRGGPNGQENGDGQNGGPIGGTEESNAGSILASVSSEGEGSPGRPGRKRPLTARPGLSPTKRTVLSILARAAHPHDGLMLPALRDETLIPAGAVKKTLRVLLVD